MKKILAMVLALVMMTASVCLAEVSLANPWVETDAEGFVTMVGAALGMPEDAENVVWRVLEAEGLGEVQFTWQDMDYTARVKCTAEFEDISGLYYENWDVEDTCSISYCEGVCKRVADGDMTVDVCLWFDVVPGIMYSVTASAPDLDGFDIEAAAEALFVPMQGDA